VDPKAVALQRQLDGEGFSPATVEQFCEAAKAYDWAILCRAPGGAAKGLIAAGHDLKGYHIKAKSCDWGPMAGLLCQWPPLSKKGQGGIGGNTKEILGYLEWLKKGAPDVAADPFPQVRLDRARLSELREGSRESRPEYARTTLWEDVKVPGVAALIAGIAWDAKKTVVLEFVLREDSKRRGLWSLYAVGAGRTHGVWTRAEPEGDFRPFTSRDLNPSKWGARSCDRLLTDPGDAKPWQPSQAEMNALGAALGQLGQRPEVPKGARSRTGELRVRPVASIMNPHPTYDRTHAVAYKNAISGDFDLFAVWPSGETSPRDILRFTENEDSIVRPGVHVPSLLHDPKSAQPFRPLVSLLSPPHIYTATPAACKGIWIHFVPSFAELDERQNESKDYGNFNNTTLAAAGVLNSLTRERNVKKGSRAAPLYALHSDEAGRPGIDEVDFPIGVFLTAADQGAIQAALDMPAGANRPVPAPSKRLRSAFDGGVPGALLLEKAERGGNSGALEVEGLIWLSMALASNGRRIVVLSSVWVAEACALALKPGDRRSLQPGGSRPAPKDGEEDPAGKFDKWLDGRVAARGEGRSDALRRYLGHMFCGPGYTDSAYASLLRPTLLRFGQSITPAWMKETALHKICHVTGAVANETAGDGKAKAGARKS